MRLVVLLSFLFLYASSLLALVQTDTHTYIPGGYNRYVLAVDRQTGQETKIPLYGCPRKILQHQDKGYVISFDKEFIEVIDLKNMLLDVLHSPQGHTDMVIWKSLGIVYGYRGDGVWVYDLTQNTDTPILKLDIDLLSSFLVSENNVYIAHQGALTCLNLETLTHRTIKLPEELDHANTNLIHHKSHLYFSNNYSGSIGCLNLTTGKFENLPFGKHPKSMIIYGDVGYVPCSGDNKICVIDLNTNTVLKEIGTQEDPVEIIAEGKKGYVVERKGKSVLLIDLEKQEVISRIQTNIFLERVEVHNDFIFLTEHDSIAHMQKNIFIIDECQNRHLTTVPNPRGMPYAFTDKDFYLNGVKVFTFPSKGHLAELTLFTPDYNGIVGDFGGDPDLALNEMYAAMDNEDYSLAATKFHEAMAYGSKKAYAIGAVAFKLGLWGGDKNNFQRFIEFYEVADIDYYLKLYKQYS